MIYLVTNLTRCLLRAGGERGCRAWRDAGDTGGERCWKVRGSLVCISVGIRGVVVVVVVVVVVGVVVIIRVIFVVVVIIIVSC